MSEEEWETDPNYENTRTDPRRGSAGQVRHRAADPTTADRTCVVHVCTSGACRSDGAHATLVELEELARLVGDAGGLRVAQYNCFGLCGRGPNVSIDWDDGATEMFMGMCTVEHSLDVIHKASAARPKATEPLMARLQELRRVSRLEQDLAKAQETIDVLDVSSVEARASDACQRRYDDALARVDSVLREAPADVHPHRLAEAVRRQAVAARACRPVSPEVEDVVVDDPSTWPHDATRAVLGHMDRA